MPRTVGSNERRGARRVAVALPPDLVRAFRARGFVVSAVLNEWDSIVGADLAGRCVPESLGRDGTLRVRAEGAAAPELQHLAPTILERLATFFGYRAATRLVILHGSRPRPKAPRRPAPRPLTAAELAHIAARAAAIDDPDLAAALERLGRSIAAAGS